MAGPFDYGISPALPIGAIIDSVVDMESLSNGRFVRLDGRAIERYKLRDAASTKIFPVGKVTSTVRTVSANPATLDIESSPTYFVAAAANGTTNIQYSSDGTTWSQTTVSTGSYAIGALLYCGSRWISTNGTESPQYTSGDNPNSTWTTSTGGVASTAAYAIAYSPSLARTVYHTGSGTSVYSLNDGSTAWTARTITSATRYGMAWSGTKFITVCGTPPGWIQTSTDGITWVDEYIPVINNVSTAALKIASNGAGIVVIAVGTGINRTQIVRSIDGGANWHVVNLPAWWNTTTGGLSSGNQPYTLKCTGGGNFLLFGSLANTPIAMSRDGLNWGIINLPGPTSTCYAAAEKGGTFVGVQTGTTSQISWVMDMSYATLPPVYRNQYAEGHTTHVVGNYYMKVSD